MLAVGGGARNTRRRRRERGCSVGHCRCRAMRQSERRGREVTVAIHGAWPADVRCYDVCESWRYCRATANELALAAGGGARPTRRRRREHGWFAGSCCRAQRQPVRRRGDVTLAIQGAR